MMRIPCNPKICSGIGFRTGAFLGIAYSGALALLWSVMAPSFVEPSLQIGGFFWFWLYGSVIGGIIGSVGGVITGYIICYLLIKLRAIQLPAWLVGFTACTCIWCAISFTVGLFFLLGDPSVRDGFLILFLYPGIIYAIAGTLLSTFVTCDRTN